MSYAPRVWCEGYLTSGLCDFEIQTTKDDIDAARRLTKALTYESDVSVEIQGVHAKIGDWMATQDTIVFHGVAMKFQNFCYILCTLGGGKTTHASLWKEHLGDAVQIINGDTPLVRIPEEGHPVVYGSPWAGKERWNVNTAAPLCGICFIGWGSDNQIRRVEPFQVFDRAMSQLYIPRDRSSSVGRVLELLDVMLERVPLYELSCDISEDAVRTSFEGMAGLRFDDYTSR